MIFSGGTYTFMSSALWGPVLKICGRRAKDRQDFKRRREYKVVQPERHNKQNRTYARMRDHAQHQRKSAAADADEGRQKFKEAMSAAVNARQTFQKVSFSV